MLAAKEGFSHNIKLPGAITEFLNDAKPLFFPLGEHMAGTAKTKQGTLYQAFCLPEVCNMPLGLLWPISINYDDFYASVKSLKSGFSAFLCVLQALKPQLTPWFAAVLASPERFVNPSFPLMEIHKDRFLSLSTGEYPDTVLDTRAFSPLVEMLNGFIWRLMCDSVLATGSIEAHQVLSTFLA
jgi:hypothetical protein